jgi:hypothetical protein
MAARESFIIGDREFAASKMGAFAANGILLKLQKIIVPIIGELAGDGKKTVDIMDMDIKNVFEILSSKLDESVMTDIILPMFKLAQVASVTDNVKIDSALAIDKVFQDADGLADLYQLIFDVLKFNFAVFFSKMASNFSGKSGGQPAME